MFLLGLTGGIASGKSTIAAHFRDNGIPVIDADQISRQITAKDAIGSKLIMREFGKQFFVNGELDRRALAKFVFSSEANTRKLESLLHPIIMREIDDRVAAYAQQEELLVVLDAPLLVESGLHILCNGVLLITADEKIRIQRAMQRSHLTEEEARRRIQRQIPDVQKRKVADYVIDNSGDLTKTLYEADTYIQALITEQEEK